jgi:hypothetical protein
MYIVYTYLNYMYLIYMYITFIIIKNHHLFDWKTKQKISDFDIWSIWPFSHTRKVDLNMSNLTTGFFYWL